MERKRGSPLQETLISASPRRSLCWMMFAPPLPQACNPTRSFPHLPTPLTILQFFLFPQWVVCLMMTLTRDWLAITPFISFSFKTFSDWRHQTWQRTCLNGVVFCRWCATSYCVSDRHEVDPRNQGVILRDSSVDEEVMEMSTRLMTSARR